MFEVWFRGYSNSMAFVLIWVHGIELPIFAFVVYSSIGFVQRTLSKIEKFAVFVICTSHAQTKLRGVLAIFNS